MLNVNPERMRYQKNALSFWLCLFSIVFNIGAFVVPYSDKKLTPDIIIGLDVIINIVFMLMVFMGSEKSKAYVFKWSYILMGIGIFQFVRILIVPLVFIIRQKYTVTGFLLNIVFLVLSGVSLVMAGLVCKKRSTILHNYLKEVEQQEKSGPTH